MERIAPDVEAGHLPVGHDDSLFKEVGGRVFLGDEVWLHLSELSGAAIATFVNRYIRDPVGSIAARERELLDLGLRYRTGPDGDTIEVTIGTHIWLIPRPRRDDAVAVDDDQAQPSRQ